MEISNDLNNISSLTEHEKIAEYYLQIIKENGLEKEFIIAPLAKGTIDRPTLLLFFNKENTNWQTFFQAPNEEIMHFNKNAKIEIKNSDLPNKDKKILLDLLKKSLKSKEIIGRAHSYIYGLLEYLRRKKGDIIYKEALEKIGFTEKHIERIKKNITEKNSYILELAITHLVLHYFGDLNYEQKEKIITTIATQSSTLELLPTKEGLLERKLVPFFIMSKLVGKFSIKNSSISYGESYTLKNGNKTKGLQGLFSRKQEAMVIYYFYRAPKIKQIWLNRPTKIVKNNKEFYPSKETIYNTGLIDNYTPIGAVAATLGVAVFKKITEKLISKILEYPVCIDQFETFFDGKKYLMNPDGTFSPKDNPQKIAVDSFGKTVTYFEPARFAFNKEKKIIYGLDESDNENLSIDKIITINSPRVKFINSYERRYQYGKFKIDIAKDYKKNPDDLTFFKEIIPAFIKRKMGTILTSTVIAISIIFQPQNFELNITWIAASFFMILMGLIADHRKKYLIERSRFFEQELDADRERDSYLQRKQIELYKEVLEKGKVATNERKKLNSIMDSLTSGLISISPDFEILSANKAFLKYSKKNIENLILQNIGEMFHPDDFEKIKELVKNSLETKKNIIKEIVLTHFTDIDIHLKTIVSPIMNDNNEIELLSITFEDRTRRREAEEAQQKQIERESEVNYKIMVSIGDASPLIDAIIKDTQNFTQKLLDMNNLVIENKKDSQDFANSLVDLEKMSEDLVSFIELIVEISDKTHLISLNAAIEAAKAKENGKAFAVVAGEINKLADQSKDGSAAQQKEIEKMINLIKKFKDDYSFINERFIKLTEIITEISQNAKESNKKAFDAQDSMSEIKKVIKSNIL